MMDMPRFPVLPPKSAIVSAAINDAVQKYGRTTGLTKGVIDGINATIAVTCDSGTATFYEQIVVYSRKPFIKAGDSGSLLTIERHSLFEAKQDFVAGVPDVLFPQVLIQVEENYADIQERSREATTLGGRPALVVTLSGESRSFHKPTRLTIVIAATEQWVYVLRSYWDEDRVATEGPLFRQVRGCKNDCGDYGKHSVS